MRRYFLIIFTLLCLMVCLTATAEHWRLHPTYNGDVHKIIAGKKYVYVIADNQPYWPNVVENATPTRSVFRYEPGEKEVIWLSAANKLTGHAITGAQYSRDRGYLLVYYPDGNIDLIFDSGETMNIPALKVADATMSRNINFVSFDPKSNQVYLATDFGYIVIDDKKGQVVTSRQLGEKVNAIAVFDNRVFIALDKGLFYSDPKSANPYELHPTEIDFPLNGLYPNNYRMLYTSGEGWDCAIGQILQGDTEKNYPPHEHFKWQVSDVEQNKEGYTFISNSNLWVFGSNGKLTKIDRPESDQGMALSSYDLSNYWVNRGFDGVVHSTTTPLASDWKDTGETFLPTGAQSFKSTWMAYSPKYGMLVRNHGTQHYFETSRPGTPDYIAGYKDLTWTPYSLSVRAPENGARVYHPNGLTIDPNSSDEVWCGSRVDGLSRINLTDVSRCMRVARVDDPELGKPGVVGYTEVQVNFPTASNFSEVAFDKQNNLWTVFYDFNGSDANRGIQLICWTPEKRLASTAKNFIPWKSWNLENTHGSDHTGLKALTHSSNTNLLLLYQQTVNPEIFLINHKGTGENPDDDEVVKISNSFSDQDGNTVPYNYILVMKEDPSTGNVWVGTDMGVFWFSPSKVMKGDTRVYRVKVPRNDGTNLADYLLDGAAVNDIAYDGKGRRWFALNGGGMVCTSPSGDQILKQISAVDSALPDDVVYALCYNPSTDSFMISTDSGLAEMYLSGSEDQPEGSEDQLRIYPNPVRPDFYGFVTIEGLEEGSLVKIADSAGNIIKELDITGGDSAQWDVTNYNHKRVRSGVYYVCVSNTADGVSDARMGKIVVIN